MKKKSRKDLDDDLRPEYDFSTMQIVARGPKRKIPKPKIIHLQPDVAKTFPDDESVNDALRLLIRLAKDSTQHRQPKRRAG
jgi:hypothetical protein